MNAIKLVISLALSCATALCSAQVHRCKDPSGELVFSDRPCAANQTGGMIQTRPSSREVERERQQAAEAVARKQARMESQGVDAYTPPMVDDALAPSQSTVVHPVLCRRAKRERELAGSLITLTAEKMNARMREEQEKVNKACGTNEPIDRFDQRIAAKAPPIQPSVEPDGAPNPRWKKCVGDTCTDTNGVRYKKDYGQPGTYRGPTGNTCRQDPYKGLICQ